MSQKILQYVEIDIDYCSLTYGVAPCTASLVASPPTGTIKCFNTLVTCQDRDNFSNDPVTLRFAVPTNDLPSDIDCIPNIKAIQFDPVVISLGKDLGQRATLTVNCMDHPHSDTGEGFDKYLADRDYDPYSQGTFWGKFRARQPFLRGRPLRWITGNTDQALAEMETRHFIVDSFSGPDNDGNFKLIAKDLLKLADGDRALAPAVSTGSLVSDIASGAGAFTVTPAGTGATYPASGYVAIGGSEICSFTRSSDVFTITRAQLGTVASAHSAGDRAQLCLVYTGQAPDVIIADLLETYAGVDAIYIPSDDWNTEITAHLNRLYTATIAQPTAVNTLISELIEQAGLSMWWNDRDQEIGLMVLRGMVFTNYLFTQDNMMADTLQIAEQPDKRLSQVHVYFGQINPLTSLTDKANYRSVSRAIDADAEDDYGSAMIKEVFSRWIPAGGRSIADRLGVILLSRFRDPPRKLQLSTLRNSTPEIVLAGGYQLQAWPLQDDTGANATVNMQVTRLRPNPDLIEVEAEEILTTFVDEEDLNTRNIIVDANTLNFNLRSTHDLIYPAAESGMTVILTINGGISAGSFANSTFAIDIGDWPAGVTIIVHVAGRIQGKGGNGYGIWGAFNVDGGTALYTRYAINLSCPGQIFGGGGGGASASNFTGAVNMWGGGGGAGYDFGYGGPSSASLGGGTGANATSEAGGAGHDFGGAGGGPGLSGNVAIMGTSGVGLPGAAIDGVSYCTTGSWDGTTFTPGALAGDVRGPQVN